MKAFYVSTVLIFSLMLAGCGIGGHTMTGTRPAVVVCRDAFSVPAFTLPQWETEEYAAVKEKGEEHIRNCARKVELAFNELFKD